MNAHHLVRPAANAKVPDFRPGDTVRVHFIIREGERVRTQAFQGVVIRKHAGKEPGATFTVRRVTHEIGVERVFPRYSPNLESVEVLRRGRVRRARLYYLRGLFGRDARIKERGGRAGAAAAKAALASEETPAEEAPETAPPDALASGEPAGMTAPPAAGQAQASPAGEKKAESSPA
jgi:large subunit ribosomal protein L19